MTSYLNITNQTVYVHKSAGIYSLEEEEEDKKKRSSHGLEYVEDGFTEEKKCVECFSSIAKHEGCFVCPYCPYTTHKACAELPQTISGHPIVDSSLKLGLTQINDTWEENECHYCRRAKRLQRGDSFYLAIKSNYVSVAGFFMHATCALIPLPAMIESSRKYICHRRQMSLVREELGTTTTGECFSCGSRSWGGWVYRCASLHCKIFFHKSCAELPWTTRYPRHFNGEHELGLKVDRPHTCIECKKSSCRHVYYCKTRSTEGCKEFMLGAECMFQTKNLQPGRLMTSHDHELFLVEDRAASFRCDACRKSYGTSGEYDTAVEVKRSWDVSFRCSECVFNLHFLCGPLPSEVKYEFHIHPLRLVDMHIDDDSGEYCCDVCEEDRDPRFRVYLCDECKFVAHLQCLFGEVKKLLKEENNTHVEFKTLGESSPNVITELESLIVRTEWTFSDLFDGNEYYNFGFQGSSIERFCKRFLTLLNYDAKEFKIVEVDIVKDLFHLNPTKFSNLCTYISTEHMNTYFYYILDGKYMRMKLVDVRGYMVPWALASDLKMLLNKYGDLCKDSTLTPKRKSITVTLLCAMVNKMRYTMAHDMTMDDVTVWLAISDSTRKTLGFKVEECDCFDEAVMSTFLGFEAIKFEKEARKSIDLKIAELESELERWKGKREKFEESASTKSEFMTQCLRRASGSKWKTVHICFSFILNFLIVFYLYLFLLVLYPTSCFVLYTKSVCNLSFEQGLLSIKYIMS